MDSSTGLTRTAISMDVLRKFDACNLIFEVFPNPSSKSIQITLDKEFIRETVPFTLYDEGRRLVLKAKGPTVAVDQLAAGMYFLQVGSYMDTTPLVVSH